MNQVVNNSNTDPVDDDEDDDDDDDDPLINTRKRNATTAFEEDTDNTTKVKRTRGVCTTSPIQSIQQASTSVESEQEPENELENELERDRWNVLDLKVRLACSPSSCSLLIRQGIVPFCTRLLVVWNKKRHLSDAGFHTTCMSHLYKGRDMCQVPTHSI
jgi:hypothetical protein